MLSGVFIIGSYIIIPKNSFDMSLEFGKVIGYSTSSVYRRELILSIDELLMFIAPKIMTLS